MSVRCQGNALTTGQQCGNICKEGSSEPFCHHHTKKEGKAPVKMPLKLPKMFPKKSSKSLGSKSPEKPAKSSEKPSKSPEKPAKSPEKPSKSQVTKDPDTLLTEAEQLLEELYSKYNDAVNTHQPVNYFADLEAELRSINIPASGDRQRTRIAEERRSDLIEQSIESQADELMRVMPSNYDESLTKKLIALSNKVKKSTQYDDLGSRIEQYIEISKMPLRLENPFGQKIEISFREYGFYRAVEDIIIKDNIIIKVDLKPRFQHDIPVQTVISYDSLGTSKVKHLMTTGPTYQTTGPILNIDVSSVGPAIGDFSPRQWEEIKRIFSLVGPERVPGYSFSIWNSEAYEKLNRLNDQAFDEMTK
jgi:hypothetical protein